MPRCEECGEAKADVLNAAPFWAAGGQNCFSLHWSYHRKAMMLCADCFADGFRICDGCGVSVDAEFWGAGYLPRDYAGDPLCPTCAKNLEKPCPKS